MRHSLSAMITHCAHASCYSACAASINIVFSPSVTVCLVNQTSVNACSTAGLRDKASCPITPSTHYSTHQVVMPLVHRADCMAAGTSVTNRKSRYQGHSLSKPRLGCIGCTHCESSINSRWGLLGMSISLYELECGLPS